MLKKVISVKNVGRFLNYSASGDVGLKRYSLFFGENGRGNTKAKFKVAGGREMLATVTRIYDFRNARVAHQEKEIADPKEAQQHLVGWIKGLKALTEAGA